MILQIEKKLASILGRLIYRYSVRSDGQYVIGMHVHMYKKKKKDTISYPWAISAYGDLLTQGEAKDDGEAISAIIEYLKKRHQANSVRLIIQWSRYD